MIVPIYFLVCGLAAGVAGVYFQDLLHPFGYVPTLPAALSLTAGFAFVYLLIQLIFMCLLKLLRPNQGVLPYLTECLSQAGVFVLLLPVLQIPIPMPHPLLEKVEPFLYLGAFVLLHLFFKLLTIFSATQTNEGSLSGVLGWGSIGVATALGAVISLTYWQSALLEARIADLEAAQTFKIGDAYIRAQSVYEGAIVTIDLPDELEENVVFRWSRHPDLSDQITHAYMTLEFNSRPATIIQEVISLDAEFWHELAISSARIPQDTTACSIQWYSQEQPAWLAQTGLRPPEPSSAQLLLGGPYALSPQGTESGPSVIIIAMDGLGREHLTHWGYNRPVTTGIDALAARGVSFENAFTPAAESAAAIMSMFTGMNPLRHGYLAGRSGNLPSEVKTPAELFKQRGYFTAAFTEGAQPEHEDLFYGSGFERGYDYFMPLYPTAAGRTTERPTALTQITHAGSKVTLDKAQRWITANRDRKFMVFIRLSELGAPRWQSRHGLGYAAPRPTVARPIDRYDTILQDIDQHLNSFFDSITQQMPQEPVIIFLSTFGLDFTEPGRGDWRRGGTGTIRLSESSLRVPLIITGPGIMPDKRNDLVSLLDVTPTLYNMLQIPLLHSMEGRDLREGHQTATPVSVMGNPVSLSIRTVQWRYVWNSGRAAFSSEMLDSPTQELIDVIRFHNNMAQPANLAGRETSTINNLHQTLKDYLETNTGISHPDN